jgi:uncharacterized membrane protein YeaQ/YmgE (transglycosylase-associated protein family)
LGRSGSLGGIDRQLDGQQDGEGLLSDIILGIAGAVAGGWIFHPFGHVGVTGVNLYSFLVAVADAVTVLVVWHAFRRF